VESAHFLAWIRPYEVFGALELRTRIIVVLDGIKSLLSRERMRVLSCFPHVRKIATVCLTPSDCHGESVAEWRHRYEIAKNATLPSFNEGFDRIVDEESDSNILTRWRHRCILHTRLTVGSWFIQRQKEWHALASVIPQIDLALTSLRVEFHLLCHGFQKDSANAIGQDGWPLPLVNLSHYYKLYFGKSWEDACATFGVYDVKALIRLMPGIVVLTEEDGKKSLEPLYLDSEPLETFLKEAEDDRLKWGEVELFPRPKICDEAILDVIRKLKGTLEKRTTNRSRRR